MGAHRGHCPSPSASPSLESGGGGGEAAGRRGAIDLAGKWKTRAAKRHVLMHRSRLPAVRMLEKFRGSARRKEGTLRWGSGERWWPVDGRSWIGSRVMAGAIARAWNQPSAPGPPKLTARRNRSIGYARLGITTS